MVRGGGGGGSIKVGRKRTERGGQLFGVVSERAFRAAHYIFQRQAVQKNKKNKKGSRFVVFLRTVYKRGAYISPSALFPGVSRDERELQFGNGCSRCRGPKYTRPYRVRITIYMGRPKVAQKKKDTRGDLFKSAECGSSLTGRRQRIDAMLPDLPRRRLDYSREEVSHLNQSSERLHERIRYCQECHPSGNAWGFNPG